MESGSGQEIQYHKTKKNNGKGFQWVCDTIRWVIYENTRMCTILSGQSPRTQRSDTCCGKKGKPLCNILQSVTKRKIEHEEIFASPIFFHTLGRGTRDSCFLKHLVHQRSSINQSYAWDSLFLSIRANTLQIWEIAVTLCSWDCWILQPSALGLVTSSVNQMRPCRGETWLTCIIEFGMKERRK